MNQLYQTSLFEEGELEEKTFSYLNVVRDMKRVIMNTKEIFDSEKFQELYAITYVASPTYFFKKTREFSKVELIMGIDDSSITSSFTEGLLTKLNINDRINFWNDMDPKLKGKFINSQYSVRFAAKDIVIHSKIYLLKGTNDMRCIIGSANFTVNAFENKPQFEEVLIFDNDLELFNLYMKRFNEIKSYTENYIPERIKKSSTDQIIVNDASVITEIIRDEIVNSKIEFHVSDQQMEEIIEIPEVKKRITEDIEKVQQVIELVTKKSNKDGIRIPITKAQFEKKIPVLKTVLSRTHKNTEELDNRKMIICNSNNHLLYTPSDKQNDQNDKELVLMSRELAADQIKERLLLLHKFIDAYKFFTLKEDPKNQSRIYEVILYGFMSAFLWKARDHYALHEGREGSRRDISPFLIIAGRSMSGKTTALEFLGRLLGGVGSNYISFEGLKSTNPLEDLFHTENLHPILIDEISLSFFTGKRGERIIKYMCNQLHGKHPVLIGTTNASGFNIPAQATTRIYYLQIDNTFDKQMKTESSTYLHDILQKIDNKLFGDFSFRLSKKIRNDENFYDAKDNLSVARDIFIDYYKMCGLEIPDYFPTKPFDDYDKRGRVIWKELYRSYKEAFEIRNDNTISIKIENFSSNLKDRQTKINYIPTEHIIEDEPVLIVKKDSFFEFLEINRGVKGVIYKVKGFFSKTT